MSINNLGVKFNIIAITETWLEDGNKDTFDLEGYKVIHVVRNRKRGGGCSLYVNELFNFNIVKPFCMSQTNMFECVTVDLEIKNHTNIKVVCVYRAPGNSISDFNKKWEEILQKMSLGNKDIYICGDFNINLLNCDSHRETEQFVNIMYGAGSFPAIIKPTHITSISATLIDNIFTNNVTENLNCGIVINETSDHLPVFVSSNPVTKNGNTVQINKRRIINATNVNYFVEALNGRDWSPLYLSDDVNYAYNYFVSKYNEDFNKCCPIKKVKVKSNYTSKPWLSKGLLNACKKKNQLYKIYVKTKSKKNVG